MRRTGDAPELAAGKGRMGLPARIIQRHGGVAVTVNHQCGKLHLVQVGAEISVGKHAHEGPCGYLVGLVAPHLRLLALLRAHHQLAVGTEHVGGALLEKGFANAL